MPATVEIKFRVSSTGARGPIESPIVNIPAVSPHPNNIYASTTPSSEIYGPNNPPSAATPPQFPDPMMFGQAPIPGFQGGGPGLYPGLGYDLPQYPSPGDEWGLDLPNFPSPPHPIPMPIPAPPYTPPGVGRGHIRHIVVPNTIIHGQNFQIKTLFRNVGTVDGTFKASTTIPSLNINNILSDQSVNLRPGEEGTIAVTLQMSDIVCITTPCDSGGPFRGTMAGTSTILHMVPATAQYQADDSKNWNYDGGGVAAYPVPQVPQPPGQQIPPVITVPAQGQTQTNVQAHTQAIAQANAMRQRITAERNRLMNLARQKRESRLEGVQSRISIGRGDRRLGGSMARSRRTYYFPFEKGWVF